MEDREPVELRDQPALRTAVARARLRWLLPTLGLALAIRQWVWTPILIRGGSMEPTLRAGQFAGVNKLAYWSRPPQRGDVVVIRTPREVIVKRIVGLPGDEIAMRHGVFYVNGHRLAEPYVQSASDDTIGAGRLGPNRFVVVGDARTASTIPAVVDGHRILGRLVFRRQVNG